MADVALLLDGYVFRNWTKINVTRSMEAAAGGFSMTAAYQAPVPIPNGTLVSLALNGTKVLEGYVDRVQLGLSFGSKSIQVSGRDRTADLVDCSVLNDLGDLKGLTAFEIATRLADPFQVKIALGFGVDPGEPFDIFKLQVGETAWDAIERACKLRGLLAFPTTDGRLLITTPGRWRAAVDLVEGENVKAASLESDHTQRFSRYICQGQSNGSDNLNGEEASHVSGSALDPEVARWRPLLIIAEGVVQPGTATLRAEWEASIRAARSDRVSITVAGWEQKPGTGMLWSFGLLVRAKVPSIALEGDLLIVGVTYRLDSRSGTTTILELARPGAFIPEAKVGATEKANPFTKYLGRPAGPPQE